MTEPPPPDACRRMLVWYVVLETAVGNLDSAAHFWNLWLETKRREPNADVRHMFRASFALCEAAVTQVWQVFSRSNGTDQMAANLAPAMKPLRKAMMDHAYATTGLSERDLNRLVRDRRNLRQAHYQATASEFREEGGGELQAMAAPFAWLKPAERDDLRRLAAAMLDHVRDRVMGRPTRAGGADPR